MGVVELVPLRGDLLDSTLKQRQLNRPTPPRIPNFLVSAAFDLESYQAPVQAESWDMGVSRLQFHTMCSQKPRRPPVLISNYGIAAEQAESEVSS